MSLTATILGCGTSTGVPRVDGEWGVCDPAEPRNRRRRCALLVTRQGPGGQTHLLIDTGPDCREQLISAGVKHIDGVLYTHDHADHTHGIDDLRILAYRARRRIPVWADAATRAVLERRFDYCFAAPAGSAYPPILEMGTLTPGEAVTIDGPGGPIAALPFRQHHGDIDSLGFRIGRMAYSSDLHDLPEESLAALAGLDLWIVDALRYLPHPSHFNLDDARGWIERVGAARALLTHMHMDLDYARLCGELPEHIRPAYDGLALAVAE